MRDVARTTPRGTRFLAVRRDLEGRLRRGEWPPGQRLPTEAALAAAYGVSVSTVRQAVQGLVDDRLVLRRQGSGTYAMEHGHALMMDRYFHVVDLAGRKPVPSHVLLSFETRRASAAVCAALRLPGRPDVVRAASLVRLQRDPVMLDVIWLARERFPDLGREEFAARRPTAFALYQRRYGVTVCRADERVFAAVGSRAVCEALRLPVGTALLEIQRVAYDAADRPVEFHQRFLHTRRHAYAAGSPGRVRLGKLR